MRNLPLLLAFTLAICCQIANAQIHPSHQVIVATNVGQADGVLSVVETASPFPSTPAAARSSHDAIVHVFNGQLYVLGRHKRIVQIRALPSLKLLQQIHIEKVKAPRDLLMVGPRMALISDYDSKHLWWLDTYSDVIVPGQSLAQYSDPDGFPDLSMMIAVGQKVYVQMQRFDRNTFTYYGAKLAVLAPGFNPDPPVILESVIDLQGVRPDYHMQTNAAGNKLWVSAPGVDGDWGGWVNTGIEEVDLNLGQSIGFVIREFNFGADIGPFVMIDDNKGFAIAHTSIVASTHLRVFDRMGQIAELHVSTNGRLDSIAYDRVRRQIFYPIPQGSNPSGGVLIFDADNHQQSSGFIPVGGEPFDMVVVQ
ncbi:MAG: hypothetical protein JNL28_09725 [Planctomycetes bacterium]|nr:hypothetical protein [Planctomycetota bacterium]